MDATNGDIVVGYDGSPEADLALRWAARSASLARSKVKVLKVDDRYDAQWIGSDREPEGELAARVESLLEEVGAEGQLERRSGWVVPELLEAGRDASMLVLGSHGHGRVAEALIGSVSQHVARHAPCPVVVVREPAPTTATRIVVGIDGSGDSADALRFACRRAELTGEVVVAVRAWKIGPVLMDHQGLLPDTIGTTTEDNELLLAESVAGVRADHPDVTLLEEAIPVAPGRALVDESRTASLVVMGSRGRGAFAGMLLGSVSHEVLCRAHCPVAIVR